MANKTTLLNDLINPQVMADMISAKLPKKLRMKGFYKVDRTLTGRAGDTITIPTWKYIGPAETVAENQPAKVTRMETKDISYTVKKAVKITELTDEAVLSGYGDPIGNATEQLRMAIEDKMDWDGIELLQGITKDKGHVLTLTHAFGERAYFDVIEALHMLKEHDEEQGVIAYLLAHPETVKRIRMSPQFIEMPGQLRDGVVTTGAVGSIAGANIVMTKKLKKDEAYLLTPKCLTAFMKRDVNVETARGEEGVIHKRTMISSDCHYLIAIENYDKLVALRWK